MRDKQTNWQWWKRCTMGLKSWCSYLARQDQHTESWAGKDPPQSVVLNSPVRVFYRSLWLGRGAALPERIQTTFKNPLVVLGYRAFNGDKEINSLRCVKVCWIKIFLKVDVMYYKSPVKNADWGHIIWLMKRFTCSVLDLYIIVSFLDFFS